MKNVLVLEYCQLIFRKRLIPSGRNSQGFVEQQFLTTWIKFCSIAFTDKFLTDFTGIMICNILL